MKAVVLLVNQRNIFCLLSLIITSYYLNELFLQGSIIIHSKLLLWDANFYGLEVFGKIFASGIDHYYQLNKTYTRVKLFFQSCPC